MGAGTRVKGYNIILSLNNKKVAGTTANSFGIKPKIKDSFIKDDLGQSQSETTGYDADFSISGICTEITIAGELLLYTDFTDLRVACKAGTLIPFVYGPLATGQPIETGTLIITDYKEDSDSENNATFSISCKLVGTMSTSVAGSSPLVKTVTLTGTSGSAVITGPAGFVFPVTFATSLTVTAAAFVTANAAAYAAQNIVVTSSVANIIFTASSVSTPFVPPVITNVVTNLAGTVA